VNNGNVSLIVVGLMKKFNFFLSLWKIKFTEKLFFIVFGGLMDFLRFQSITGGKNLLLSW
jgi:hypothetical protein